MLRATDPRPTLALLAALFASPLAGAQGPGAEGNGTRPGAQSRPATAGKSEGAGKSEDVGRFENGTFKSESLERDVGYGVYLPPGYEQEKTRRYPVVYWLHGMFEDHARFNLRGGSKVVADLYASGKLPPMIIATPDGGRTSFYSNGIKSGAYEDLIVRDFITFIEDHYRTTASRAGRAITGTSMGGSGALKIAFKRPELFAVVATHSAALFPVDLDELPERFRRTLDSEFGATFKAIWGDPIDKRLWASDNPLALAGSLDAESLQGLAIYMDCGDRDRYGFQNVHRQFHTILETRKIPHEWHERPGNHGWGDGYLGNYLHHSLEFVAAHFAGAKSEKPEKIEKVETSASRPAR